MLLLLVAAANILAVKVGTRPTFLVSQPALSASLPCQPACLVSQHALFCYPLLVLAFAEVDFLKTNMP
jgi:hypothetical protein